MPRRDWWLTWAPTGLVCVAVVLQPFLPQVVFLAMIGVAVAVMGVGLVVINRDMKKIMAEADALAGKRRVRHELATHERTPTDNLDDDDDGNP